MPNYSSCNADGCERDDSMMFWNRWASPAQIELFIGMGELPPGSTEAQIQTCACPDHYLDPDSLMDTQYTHDHDCAAPPVCDCSVYDMVVGTGGA